MRKKQVLISVLLWATLIATGCYIASLPRSRGAFQRKFYFVGLFVIGGAAQTGINAFFDRQRVRDLTALLTARGFVPNSADGSPPQVLHYTPDKAHTSFKAVYSAVGIIGQLPAHISEYRYTIGAGKQATTHRMTEVAVDFAPTAPPLVLARRTRPLNTKALAKLPRTGLPIDDDLFRAQWDSPDIHESLAMLTPELVSFIATAPVDERQWRVGDGWLSITVARVCKGPELDMLFHRVVAAAGKLEPALLPASRPYHVQG